MSLSDPISDMLNRIRNASSSGAKVVAVDHSAMKNEIAAILKREGYIRDCVVEAAGGRKTLQVTLKYGADRQSVIKGLRRISRPGLRRYVGFDKIPRVLGGMGISILSTPQGVMTDKVAREKRVGGEVLCQVW